MIEIWARFKAHSLRSLSQAGSLERLTQALLGLGYYLEKTLIPARLSPDQLAWPWAVSRGPYLLAGASVAAVSAACIAARKRRPAGLAAYAFYAITLIPVLGLLKVGHETVAARYSYVPCLGWALLAGAGLRDLARAGRAEGGVGKAFIPAFACAAAVLALLSFESRRQIPAWHDSIALWRSVLRLEPTHPLARRDLGVALLAQDRVSEAALVWQEHLKLFPRDEETRKVLQDVLAKAWRVRPTTAALCDGAGVDLIKRGELERAVWFFNKALKTDPGFVRGHDHLGVALTRLGRYDEALAHFESALRLKPGDRAARAGLGLAKTLKGRG